MLRFACVLYVPLQDFSNPQGQKFGVVLFSKAACVSAGEVTSPSKPRSAIVVKLKKATTTTTTTNINDDKNEGSKDGDNGGSSGGEEE